VAAEKLEKHDSPKAGISPFSKSKASGLGPDHSDDMGFRDKYNKQGSFSI
jgi:hypothetical protein